MDAASKGVLGRWQEDGGRIGAEVQGNFTLIGGRVHGAGGGVLRVRSSGNLYLNGSSGQTACKLDNFTLDNRGTGSWNGAADITGLNSSAFENNGTFTSNNGDSMTGDMTFTNNGSLIKAQTGTTTIDVDFTNNGNITVNSGMLIFTHDFTFPASSSNTITGTLEAANLINSGTLTVNGTVDGNLTNNGSLALKGTVTGNLINNGVLDPGNSPGLAVLQGNFTQTANGGIGIDLSRDSGSGGAPPVPGVDYDSPQVTGTAQLAGHLQLIAGGTFDRPQSWTELPFLTAGGGVSGGFEDVGNSDFDDYWNWSVIQRLNEVVFKCRAGLFRIF